MRFDSRCDSQLVTVVVENLLLKEKESFLLLRVPPCRPVRLLSQHWLLSEGLPPL